ncbi:hypothetical protein DPEC_G00326370 [Dallia pectoralis]|uniref:Uncharacterized protein n=1 Tax=Dallia pectoralis TaxID=75939 RepID=A0ACC2F7T0_DALPE|nr:hypothetical protein DPEC_G00326370 [Dallia pectoralis]
MMKSKSKDIHQASTLPSIWETYLSSVVPIQAENSDQPSLRKKLGHGKTRDTGPQVGGYGRSRDTGPQFGGHGRSRDTGPQVGGHGRKQMDWGLGAGGLTDKATVGIGSDQEAIDKRQVLIDKRHLVAYRCMYRLRDVLYHRYFALLTEKVRTQRLERKRLALEAPAAIQDEHTQKQRKLARSTLCHDNTFLRSLPKSTYYLIQDLQNLLSQRGYLKNLQDHEQLWLSVHDHHLRPAQLDRTVQEIRKTMIGSRSAPDMMSEVRKWSQMLGPPTEETEHLDQILETENRLMSQERLPEIELKEGRPEIELKEGLQEKDLGETCAADLPRVKQQPEHDDIKQRLLIKVKDPRFAALHTSFLKNLKTNKSPVVVEAIPEKSKKAEMTIKRLRRMHTLSLTNMDVSQRLLQDRDRHILCCSDQGRSVRDLMKHVFHAKEKKRRSSAGNIPSLPPLPCHDWTRTSRDIQISNLASGLERSGLEKSGLQRSDLERSGLERSGLERSGLERSGLEKSGLQRSDLERSGLERSGLERSDLERSGLERSSLERSGPERLGQRLRNTPSAGDTHACVKTPEPLSMEEVCLRDPSKVIDCGSTLWRIYNGDETA